VLIDPQARIPRDARVLTDGSARTLWCVAAERRPTTVAPHVDLVSLPVRAGRFEPQALLEMLRERGLGRVLVEGGGRTVSDFLSAGLLDRLYLTTAPILVGDGVPGVRFAGSDLVSQALTAPVQRFSLGRDICTVFDFAAIRLGLASSRQAEDIAVVEIDAQQPGGQLGTS
jgi:3,4-dihydroxy 2-butanone 4-phosphate synthase/GTP cyclohydrolase II